MPCAETTHRLPRVKVRAASTINALIREEFVRTIRSNSRRGARGRLDDGHAAFRTRLASGARDRHGDRDDGAPPSGVPVRRGGRDDVLSVGLRGAAGPCNRGYSSFASLAAGAGGAIVATEIFTFISPLLSDMPPGSSLIERNSRTRSAASNDSRLRCLVLSNSSRTRANRSIRGDKIVAVRARQGFVARS